jgi:hypothetical protein
MLRPFRPSFEQLENREVFSAGPVAALNPPVSHPTSVYVEEISLKSAIVASGPRAMVIMPDPGVTGPLAPNEATATRRTVCELEPIEGSVNSQSERDSRGLTVMAMWQATAHCDDPALDGQTVDIQQLLRLRPLGGGEVGGRTQILIDFTGAGLRAVLRGRAGGEVVSSDSTTETAQILIDFTSAGLRAKLHGQATLTINRASGEVVEFRPGSSFYDITLTDVDVAL